MDVEICHFFVVKSVDRWEPFEIGYSFYSFFELFPVWSLLQ